MPGFLAPRVSAPMAAPLAAPCPWTGRWPAPSWCPCGQPRCSWEVDRCGSMFFLWFRPEWWSTTEMVNFRDMMGPMGYDGIIICSTQGPFTVAFDRVYLGYPSAFFKVRICLFWFVARNFITIQHQSLTILQGLPGKHYQLPDLLHTLPGSMFKPKLSVGS